MAPATAIQKLHKAARNHQNALGGGWATPFPRDILKQQQKSTAAQTTKVTKVTKVTKIIKVRPQPSNFFKSAEELLAMAEKSTTIKAQAKPIYLDHNDSTAEPVMTSNKAGARQDSLAPFSPAPKTKKSPKPNNNGASIKGNLKSSSCSPTSARGVYLLLSIIESRDYDNWTTALEEHCSLFHDDFNEYYSSIEFDSHNSRYHIYADCENKVMAMLLKSKLDGDIILGKQLICEFI
ncbi:unnamed protein product [Aureobasidium uvarum]|uniref:Uncharacterized protein n=1 Tax=Aureobasidium uvarum TaxID=2773716 RepID=A0A9N8PRM6_9PEZI|nr:unnamed protein product [Aureobasidium uvarum]